MKSVLSSNYFELRILLLSLSPPQLKQTVCFSPDFMRLEVQQNTHVTVFLTFHLALWVVALAV